MISYALSDIKLDMSVPRRMKHAPNYLSVNNVDHFPAQFRDITIW